MEAIDEDSDFKQMGKEAHTDCTLYFYDNALHGLRREKGIL